MNSRERIEAAFEHRPTADCIPIYHLGFSSDVASALLGHEAYVGGGIQQWREATALWQGEDAHQGFLERSFQDAIDIALLCEHDIVRPSYWRYPAKPTKRIDEHTFLYAYGDEAEWRVLRYDPGSEQCHIYPYRPQRALTLEDLDGIVARREEAVANHRPQESDFRLEIRAQHVLGDERVVRVGAASVGIPTDAAWLEATVLSPDLVGRLLDTQVERAARDVPFLAGHGFRYFFGGSDFASNDGPMYSPRTFRDLLLPRIRRISEICHGHGGYHLFASDGDLWSVSEPLFEQSGVHGYYEIDRRAGMDLATLRTRFPELTLIGNISSHTVHTGSREDVVAEAISCLDEARRSHGIVVGTSNYFVPHTPIENVRALLEIIHTHR